MWIALRRLLLAALIVAQLLSPSLAAIPADSVHSVAPINQSVIYRSQSLEPYVLWAQTTIAEHPLLASGVRVIAVAAGGLAAAGSGAIIGMSLEVNKRQPVDEVLRNASRYYAEGSYLLALNEYCKVIVEKRFTNSKHVFDAVEGAHHALGNMEAGEYKKAEPFFRSTLDYAATLKITDPYWTYLTWVYSLMCLSIAHWEKSDYAASREFCATAIQSLRDNPMPAGAPADFIEKHHQLTAQSQILLADQLNSDYSDRKDNPTPQDNLTLDQAIQALRSASASAASIKSLAGVKAIADSRLALMLLERHRVGGPEADAAFTEAEVLAKAAESSKTATPTYVLGQVSEIRGEWQRALDYYQEARRRDDKKLEAALSEHIAGVSLRLNRLNDAWVESLRIEQPTLLSKVDRIELNVRFENYLEALSLWPDIKRRGGYALLGKHQCLDRAVGCLVKANLGADNPEAAIAHIEEYLKLQEPTAAFIEYLAFALDGNPYAAELGERLNASDSGRRLMASLPSAVAQGQNPFHRVDVVPAPTPSRWVQQAMTESQVEASIRQGRAWALQRNYYGASFIFMELIRWNHITRISEVLAMLSAMTKAQLGRAKTLTLEGKLSPFNVLRTRIAKSELPITNAPYALAKIDIERMKILFGEKQYKDADESARRAGSALNEFMAKMDSTDPENKAIAFEAANELYTTWTKIHVADWFENGDLKKLPLAVEVLEYGLRAFDTIESGDHETEQKLLKELVWRCVLLTIWSPHSSADYLKKAQEVTQQCVALGPHTPVALLTQALLAIGEKRWSDAEEWFGKIPAPSLAGSQWPRLRALLMLGRGDQKFFEQAVNVYRSVRKPDIFHDFSGGFALYERGEYPEARAAWSKVTEDRFGYKALSGFDEMRAFHAGYLDVNLRLGHFADALVNLTWLLSHEQADVKVAKTVADQLRDANRYEDLATALAQLPSETDKSADAFVQTLMGILETEQRVDEYVMLSSYETLAHNIRKSRAEVRWKEEILSKGNSKITTDAVNAFFEATWRGLTCGLRSALAVGWADASVTLSNDQTRGRVLGRLCTEIVIGPEDGLTQETAAALVDRLESWVNARGSPAAKAFAKATNQDASLAKSRENAVQKLRQMSAGYVQGNQVADFEKDLALAETHPLHHWENPAHEPELRTLESRHAALVREAAAPDVARLSGLGNRLSDLRSLIDLHLEDVTRRKQQIVIDTYKPILSRLDRQLADFRRHQPSFWESEKNGHLLETWRAETQKAFEAIGDPIPGWCAEIVPGSLKNWKADIELLMSQAAQYRKNAEDRKVLRRFDEVNNFLTRLERTTALSRQEVEQAEARLRDVIAGIPVGMNAVIAQTRSALEGRIAGLWRRVKAADEEKEKQQALKPLRAADAELEKIEQGTRVDKGALEAWEESMATVRRDTPSRFVKESQALQTELNLTGRLAALKQRLAIQTQADSVQRTYADIETSLSGLTKAFDQRWQENGYVVEIGLLRTRARAVIPDLPAAFKGMERVLKPRETALIAQIDALEQRIRQAHHDVLTQTFRTGWQTLVGDFKAITAPEQRGDLETLLAREAVLRRQSQSWPEAAHWHSQAEQARHSAEARISAVEDARRGLELVYSRFRDSLDPDEYSVLESGALSLGPLLMRLEAGKIFIRDLSLRGRILYEVELTRSSVRLKNAPNPNTAERMEYAEEANVSGLMIGFSVDGRLCVDAGTEANNVLNGWFARKKVTQDIGIVFGPVPQASTVVSHHIRKWFGKEGDALTPDDIVELLRLTEGDGLWVLQLLQTVHGYIRQNDVTTNPRTESALLDEAWPVNQRSAEKRRFVRRYFSASMDSDALAGLFDLLSSAAVRPLNFAFLLRAQLRHALDQGMEPGDTQERFQVISNGPDLGTIILSWQEIIKTYAIGRAARLEAGDFYPSLVDWGDYLLNAFIVTEADKAFTTGLLLRLFYKEQYAEMEQRLPQRALALAA